MSLTVWKYPLEAEDVQYVDMPRLARSLSVQTQNQPQHPLQAGDPPEEVPCLWVLVDPDDVLERHTIRITGTGHPRDDLEMANYIGTFQMAGGRLVFHVFDDIARGRPTS